MQTIRDIGRVRDLTKGVVERGGAVGLVPTMGALHEGHLSLIREAKRQTDYVVVSVFVNPTQFGPNEDFTRYPRTLDRDTEILAAERVDLLFTPASDTMYPDGYKTYIEVEELGKRLCGLTRPGHFRGVTTVVFKLFAIVSPRYAFFGQKDAQQTILIQKMVRDLNLDVQIVVCPIIREGDGVALSSRNRYLSPEERRAARVLYRALQQAQELIAAGEVRADRVIKIVSDTLAAEPRARKDYVEIVDTQTLEPLTTLRGECLLALAVYIGSTRLIDNVVLKI